LGADGEKSIAVLPLKPINSANRDEIYEIGIADSLIIKLNSMKGFKVRPLSATRKYSDIGQDPIAAGKEQQVDYVLASNYQLAGGKIKVTSQLFNVANGQSEGTYQSEQDAANVFMMQDAIAGEVGNKLLARFATTSSRPMAKRGTTNEEAYGRYLQGRNLTFNRTPEGTRKAVENFEQAIRLDPNFARAYSGMAHALIASGNLGGGLPRVEYEKAREVVQKALALDNNLAEGYAVLGELKFTYEWDFAGAEKDLLRAIELEPNSDLAHEQYASYLVARGRFEEAIAEIKTALEIDPNSLMYQLNNGRILYQARHYDEAILQLKRLIEVNQDYPLAYGWLLLVYEMKGDSAQAYESFKKFQKRIYSEHIELFQKTYETSGWQAVRQKSFELNKVNDQMPSANYYAMARQCALMGDKEQAFAYLNKAIEKRQGQMCMLNVDPPFDILRADPRFDELVRRVGLK
jgi:tetratricopeptide (TPR) repeat protein/TolB-like protein